MEQEEKGQEEKGFVIKDRRRFTPEGEPKKNEQENEQKKESGPSPEQPPKQERPPRKSPLPEVTFSTFIFSLVSSVMVHLGDVPEPSTGQIKKDLDLAKHTIDIIAMLREKTQGNLSEEEQKMIDHVLYDLRMRYVKVKG